MRLVLAPEGTSTTVRLFFPASTEVSVDFLKLADHELRNPTITYGSVDENRTRWITLVAGQGETEVEYTLFLNEGDNETELLRLAGLKLTKTEGDET